MREREGMKFPSLCWLDVVTGCCAVGVWESGSEVEGEERVDDEEREEQSARDGG